VIETFLYKSGAVRNVDWIFIFGVPAGRCLDEYETLDKMFYDLVFKHEVATFPVPSTITTL
jgi:hypothetical protein